MPERGTLPRPSGAGAGGLHATLDRISCNDTSWVRLGSRAQGARVPEHVGQRLLDRPNTEARRSERTEGRHALARTTRFSGDRDE